LNQQTDFIGKAQTGTGKTAAYGLPLLQKIDPSKKAIQAIILCPTRELGQQVAKQLFKFTKFSDRIFTECVYGGARIEPQLAALKRPTHIIVATPGRLTELVALKALDLSNVKTIVLDEADEMLSMGFKDELDKILNLLSSVNSKWLFSATMPPGINQIVNQHLSPNSIRVDIKGKSGVNKKVTHQYLICSEIEKPLVLLQFLKSQGKNRGIVFCRTKASTQQVAENLLSKGIKVEQIHGDRLQKEREKAMRSFRKEENIRVLIATDLAARGIDVNDLSFVVHYQMPDQDEYYVHRSGRTGRGGKAGVSISLVTSTEMKYIRNYEKKLGLTFNQIRRAKGK
jgi:ATP-dependent RNA helicase DeaD